jgi:hypothetical protein
MSDCTDFRRVKARKDHRCACHRVIRDRDGERRGVRCVIHKGDKHEVQSGIFNGEPFRIRLCLFHAAVCSAIWHKENDGRLAFCDEMDLDELDQYIESGSFQEWKDWLGQIREELRELKAKP